MRLKLYWNHWFWVTILLSLIGQISCESFTVENPNAEFSSQTGGLPLVSGARGGRLVIIPEPDRAPQPESNPGNVQVSQSVSVSKVSVKRGHISSADDQEGKPEPQAGVDSDPVYDVTAYDYPNDKYDAYYNYGDRMSAPLAGHGGREMSAADYYYYEDTHDYSGMGDSDDNLAESEVYSYNVNQQEQEQPATDNSQPPTGFADNYDNTDGLLAPFGVGFGRGSGGGFPKIFDGVGLILNNRVARPPPPPPPPPRPPMSPRHFRRLDPVAGIRPAAIPPPNADPSSAAFSGYNLVYIDPAKSYRPQLTSSTPRPPQYSFLNSLLSKLKALALATQASIRMSNSVRSRNNLPGTGLEARPSQGELELTPSWPPVPAQELPTFQSSSEENQESPASTDVLDSVNKIEDLENDLSLNDTDNEISRSSYARGRSLSVEVAENLLKEQQALNNLGVESVVDLEVEKIFDSVEGSQNTGLEADFAQKKDSQPGLVEVIETVEKVEKKGDNPDQLLEEEVVDNVEVIEEINGKEKLVLEDENEYSVKIKDVDVGISSLVGLILGIVIFVLIAAVFLLLAVYKRRKRGKKIQDDAMSQSSYMSSSSCSTTLSDTTVNYGPAWDKDVGQEDLYSLDNDSFLNSLEAVTAEYWLDKK